MPVSLPRRRFLAVLGGGTVLAATPAAAWLGTRTPHAALEPWSLAGGYDEPRRRALSHALLAPNPHNRQPWIVDLSETDVVTLYAQPDRRLPHTDPYGRQITIGLGCFWELMRMAAAEDGWRIESEAFPDGWSPDGLDARPVARARFVRAPGVERDPLFAHVTARRTCKEPYDPARVPSAEAAAGVVAGLAHTTGGSTVDPAEVAAWRELAVEASTIEMTTPRTHKESVDLFRIGRAEIEANPDGIDLGGPMLSTLAAFGMLTREGSADPESTQFQQGASAVLDPLRSAPAWVWLVSADNDRATQLGVGADWLRANLRATAAGLSFNPHSQSLQEYPEMAALHRTVHERLAPDGGTVQMLARVGYGPEVAPSPRWRLETRIA